MIAEIIAIGTEIVTGATANTNTSYLSQKLLELGIETYYHTSVDDSESRLMDVINIALKRADLIITIGGLGPTNDDLTKETIAKTLELDLEMDIDMEESINNYFVKGKRVMSENNRKQALKPKGSIFIKNANGTAPGIVIEEKGRRVVMLPGPPHELKPMFEEGVVPLIKGNLPIIVKSINTVGVGESDLESQLLNLNLDTRYTKVTTFTRNGYIEIKIISKGNNEEYLKEEVYTISNKINDNFKKYIYGYNNTRLEEVVISLLREREYLIGISESCTGGLISHKITSIPGASDVLERGVVTYSNKSKVNELNVNTNTLNKYGAVSGEVAYEMARGLMDKANIDVSLSITGIAGPGGETDDKPVGLVYICVMTKNNYKIIEHIFNGSRRSIQNRASIMALNEVRKVLVK